MRQTDDDDDGRFASGRSDFRPAFRHGWCQGTTCSIFSPHRIRPPVSRRRHHRRLASAASTVRRTTTSSRRSRKGARGRASFHLAITTSSPPFRTLSSRRYRGATGASRRGRPAIAGAARRFIRCGRPAGTLAGDRRRSPPYDGPASQPLAQRAARTLRLSILVTCALPQAPGQERRELHRRFRARGCGGGATRRGRRRPWPHPLRRSATSTGSPIATMATGSRV